MSILFLVLYAVPLFINIKYKKIYYFTLIILQLLLFDIVLSIDTLFNLISVLLFSFFLLFFLAINRNLGFIILLINILFYTITLVTGNEFIVKLFASNIIILIPLLLIKDIINFISISKDD